MEDIITMELELYDENLDECSYVDISAVDIEYDDYDSNLYSHKKSEIHFEDIVFENDFTFMGDTYHAGDSLYENKELIQYATEYKSIDDIETALKEKIKDEFDFEDNFYDD